MDESFESGNSQVDGDWIDTSGKKSFVWKYFSASRVDKNLAKCKKCNAILKIHNSTSTMKYHLEKRHDEKNNSNVKPSIEKSLLNMGPSVMEMDIADLICNGFVSFKTISSNKTIRKYFDNCHYQGQVPKRIFDVKNFIVSLSEKLKNQMKEKLLKRKGMNERFSLSFDEWSSVSNKRYVSINVHTWDHKAYHLGLTRLLKNATADACIKLIEEEMKRFSLSLCHDIVAITTDGAASMKKMGKTLPIVHQVCHQHGIHLAVTDVLYKRVDEVNEMPEDVHDETTGVDSDEEDEDEETLIDFGLSYESDNNHKLVPTYSKTIQKVRTIVKKFKKSPTYTDKLNELLRATHSSSRKQSLILDCKTRWNSLLHMLKRFLEFKDVIHFFALREKLPHLILSNDELTLVENLCEVLETLEAGSLLIGRQECDISIAEKTFSFMIMKLNKMSTTVAYKLSNSLKQRFSERNCNLSSVLYVLNGNTNDIDRQYFLTMASSLFIRLYKSQQVTAPPSEPNVIVQEQEDDDIFEVNGNNEQVFCDDVASALEEFGGEEDEPITKKSKMDELNEYISSSCESVSSSSVQKPSTPGNKDVFGLLGKELDIFITTGELPKNLELIRRCILTIPPSSVEAERSFSAAGCFVSKIRNSFKDDTINALTFLRNYLNK